ncbi:hypothetical protein KIPB_009592 [Kipferlia bialata]|uniref:Uncharacterized protein n=1 Tax=Kipferlia bialata TaxID=797122 RepID=A0A9K3GLN2_9EUKA|nr:hypothetical protein KIPB_009592 [Kipferlia bialata]|eukprot:g9592.t1
MAEEHPEVTLESLQAENESLRQQLTEAEAEKERAVAEVKERANLFVQDEVAKCAKHYKEFFAERLNELAKELATCEHSLLVSRRQTQELAVQHKYFKDAYGTEVSDLVALVESSQHRLAESEGERKEGERAEGQRAREQMCLASQVIAMVEASQEREAAHAAECDSLRRQIADMGERLGGEDMEDMESPE